MSRTRWNQRPWTSRLLRFVAFLVPVVFAGLAAIATARLLPRPGTLGGLVGWWALLASVVVAVLVIVDRLSRRILPLAALFRLTLVFPDRAPSRLRMVRIAGSVRRLEERLLAAQAAGERDVADAAEHILALAAALNEHDRVTRGHGERVRVFTDLIAVEMGIEPDDQDRLRWAALLHDIGKLSIHADILNKPGPPTEEEWNELRRHPEEGAKLIAPIAEWLGPWSPAIEQHHEKFDGTGYPQGLAGDEISFGARVVAVADAYDAITAARSYKDPISAEAARREVARSAGTQFDPRVVRALLNISLGRLYRAIGVASWFAHLPLIGGLEKFSRQIGIVTATGTLVAALTAGGYVEIPDTREVPTASPVATVDEASSPPVVTTTTVGPTTTSALEATTSSDLPTTTTVPVTTTTVPATTTTVPVTTTTVPVTTTTVPVTTTTTLPGAPPVAVADTAVTAEDAAITIDVLDNDSDPDGGSVVITGAWRESQAGGSLACATACRYTPPPDFWGPDRFEYTITDPDGRTATGQVTISVTPVNDVPVARDDEYPADFVDPLDPTDPIVPGDTVWLRVLLNDSDADGDTLEIQSVSSALGEVHWVPGSTRIGYTAPSGFTGTDSFVYTITDGVGPAATATVTITVTSPSE